MREDPEYRLNHKTSNKQWAATHPGYWKAYRKRNPEKAERNRILQHLRNRRRPKQRTTDAGADGSLIAKVDPSSRPAIKVAGEFFLVPVIAEVDALKVYLYQIPTP